MPNVHILRCEEPQYLPFARARLKQLRKTGLVYASQTYDVGGVLIRVRKVGTQEYIDISGSPAEIWMLVTVHQLPYTDAPTGDFDAWGFFTLPATKVSASKLFKFAKGAALTAQNARLHYAGQTDRTYDASHYSSEYEYYLERESYTPSNHYGAITGFSVYGGNVISWHTTRTLDYTTYNDHELYHGYSKTETFKTEFRGLNGGAQSLTYTEHSYMDSKGGAFGAGIINVGEVSKTGTLLHTAPFFSGADPDSLAQPPEQLAHFKVVLNALSPTLSNPPVDYRLRVSAAVIEPDPDVVNPIPLVDRTETGVPYTRREVGPDNAQDATHIYRQDISVSGVLGLFSRKMVFIHDPIPNSVYLNGTRYIAVNSGAGVGEFISGDIVTGPVASELLNLRSIAAIAEDPVFMEALNQSNGFQDLNLNTFHANSSPTPGGVANAIIRVQFVVDRKNSFP